MDAQDIELTLADIVDIARRSWVTTLLFVLLFGIAAGVWAFVSPRVYRAEVLLALAGPDNATTSGLAQLANRIAPIAGLLGMNNTSGMASEQVRVAMLRSRQLTEDFITDRNLLPVLFAKEWDPTRQSWKEEAGQTRAPTINEAVRFFDEEVRSVSEDRKTGLITVAIEWTDPQLAAEWANDLVARANEMLRTRAIEEGLRSIAYLEDELKQTPVVERRQVIYGLVESKTNEIMMANARKEYAFLVVDPAVRSDQDAFVKPKRALTIFAGLVCGFAAGVLFGIVRWARSRSQVSAET